MIPRATYRIQFHRDFPFADAVPLAPYLADLGISHLYASPIATARSGSNHGYDVVDPTRINPELGGEDGFRTLAAAMKRHGLGIILDIVPNHMAVGGDDNRWWLDVLEHGPASDHARFFDIDWDAHQGKLLAPFLGSPYEEVLHSGDLVLDRQGSRFSVLAYGTHRFPLRPEDQALLAAEGTDVGAHYDGTDAAGAERLHALLGRQHYRLAGWRTAADEINWRRFFDITELAGLRVEEEDVFAAVHALPLRLYAERLIDGVRVDHVDGLADPAGYARRLRAAMQAARPEPGYLVVEKILATGEPLNPAWATDGTSGYDFMNDVSALLHDGGGAAALADHWHALSGRAADFAEEEYAARLEILDRTFPCQRDAAVAAFHRLAASPLETRDLTAGMLRRAMTALLAVFPAYRTYGAHADTAIAPDPRLADAIARARSAAPAGEAFVVDRLADWITGARDLDDPVRRDAVRRFEQLSAPLSAKSVEDTAFYRYGRLLSRTDVGFDPALFALDIGGFVSTVRDRARDHPHAMLTTATHDHKRGEDVRARLAVLSEIPDRWIALSTDWAARFGDPAIDAADLYILFQTLVGACPPDISLATQAAFAERVVAWNRKALREAKLRSSWVEPDTDYEDRCAAHIRRLLADTAFLDSLNGFVAAIAPAGIGNSVVQAVLRNTLPGVPDCYQGTEFWDFSLVDPDNRRPVDYPARVAALAAPADAAVLLADWRDGRLKQHAIAAALGLRRAHPALFAEGTFAPVQVSGTRHDRIFAFVRRHGDHVLLVVATLHMADMLVDNPALLVPADWWADTVVHVPGHADRAVAPLLAGLPYALVLL